MDWKKFFFENYKAKLALLLMAIFLWFFVISSREYDQTLSIPLRITHLKEGKIFLQDPPDLVQVRFHGKGTSLLLLSLFSDVHLNLDLSTINYFYDFPLRRNQVKWPSSIDVQIQEIVAPDTVHIRLDDQIERKLKVTPLLSIKPAPGYIQMSPLYCQPDTVTVIGPKSIVKNWQFIPTKAKLLENVTGPLNVKLELIPPEPGRIELSPNSVKASVTVEKIIEKKINQVPVNVLHLPPGRIGSPEPGTVNLKVRGAESILKALSRDDISVFINAASQNADSAAYAPEVQLPPGAELVDVQPQWVSVVYE